ncbi:MAG: metallophosphoesterase [Candidatus Altiarchaeota archaeon]|nr:metallophosphoesterase [Candidatus Altiarchaeota archaeon]
MKIVQISDLHVTGIHYVKEWGERVVRDVNSIKPEVLLVTGDLTQEGLCHEYKEAAKYLRRMKAAHKLVIPGNHDAKNEGYTIFEEMFGGRFPRYQNKNVFIQGVDSTQPDLDDGHIGRENYHYITEELAGAKGTKILALHHHLIPIPGTGRERQIPTDSGDVLKLCVDLGIDYVFSGHKHHQWVWKLGDTHFITAGTATTRRLKGDSYPSYNILEITDHKAVLTEVNVRDREKKTLLSTAVPEC